jgi:hypothetical protein
MTAAVRRRVWQHDALRNLPVFHKIALALGLIALQIGATLVYPVHVNASHTEMLRTFDRNVIEPLGQAEKLRNEIAALQTRILSLSVAENQPRPACRIEKCFSTGWTR